MSVGRYVLPHQNFGWVNSDKTKIAQSSSGINKAASLNQFSDGNADLIVGRLMKWKSVSGGKTMTKI